MKRHTMGLHCVTNEGEVVGFVFECENEHDLVAACYIRQAINGKNVEFSDNILTLICDGNSYHFTGARGKMDEIYRLIKHEKRALEIIQTPAELMKTIVKLRGIPYDKVELIGGSVSKRTVELSRMGIPSTERQRMSLSSSGW